MALNKQQLIAELTGICNTHAINYADICITCGGASTIYNLREETNDIDVDVCELEVWNKLVSIPGVKTKHYPALGLMTAADVVSIGNVDFHWRDNNQEKDYIKNYSMYLGFNVSTKLELLEDRVKLGREKDLEDINLLKDEYQNLLSDELKQRLSKMLNG